MKKEFKNFFRNKYLVIIIPVLIVITVFFWFMYNLPDQPIDILGESLYSNFIDDIKIYDTQEELQELYDNNENPSSFWDVSYSSNQRYKSLLYRFSLEKQLPYDSLVTFSEEFKFNQFSYLGSFKIPIMLFVLFLSMLVGGFYQSAEISNKMSKLIYTSGEKRSKIIDRKYLVSLLMLIAVVTVFESIVALLGLMYSYTGAKYCVVYLGGNSLKHLNYFGYFCLFWASHTIALIVNYTFVYYLSVVFKNGIIPVCTCFCTLFVCALLRQDFLIIDMISRGGFIEVLYNVQDSNGINLNGLCWYIPIVLVAIVPFVISRFTIKRADYSR